MDLVELSRWQFAITTVYHYIFVPLTIGLAPVVAIMQTAWHKTGKDHWYRATRFFGTMFLINFAMGVVTGIVQEFQFGMNWSDYSRFVGDVFGAPLAFEGLAAFFFESIFLGAWIFGWGRLPKALHLASIWIVSIAVNVSAYFIIVANSFMQHPVGARFNPDTGRAELIDFWALLTNPTALAAFPHAVFGSWITAGTVVAAVSLYLALRKRKQTTTTPADAQTAETTDTEAGAAEKARIQDSLLWRASARLGAWVILAGTIGVSMTGHLLAQLMFSQQPMKMASAEALCETTLDPEFSILSIATFNNCETARHLLGVPYVLSFLAANQFTGVTLRGVTDLQAMYEQVYGMADYSPNLFVTYWSFRLMIGFLAVPVILALFTLWFTRKKAPLPRWRWLPGILLATMVTPYLSNIFGWIFTEMGRQPWIVAPNPAFEPGDALARDQIHLLVDFGVSDHSPAVVLISMLVFTILYGALAVAWFWLQKRHVLTGVPEPGASAHIDELYAPDDESEPTLLSFGKASV